MNQAKPIENLFFFALPICAALVDYWQLFKPLITIHLTIRPAKDFIFPHMARRLEKLPIPVLEASNTKLPRNPTIFAIVFTFVSELQKLVR